MIDSLISSFTDFQSIKTNMEMSTSVTKKALDTQELQGNLALKLINSLPSSTSSIDGKGSFIDLM
jgi:hypothetical protein